LAPGVGLGSGRVELVVGWEVLSATLIVGIGADETLMVGGGADETEMVGGETEMDGALMLMDGTGFAGETDIDGIVGIDCGSFARLIVGMGGFGPLETPGTEMVGIEAGFGAGLSGKLMMGIAEPAALPT
jgi:hypothetical protein